MGAIRRHVEALTVRYGSQWQRMTAGERCRQRMIEREREHWYDIFPLLGFYLSIGLLLANLLVFIGADGWFAHEPKGLIQLSHVGLIGRWGILVAILGLGLLVWIDSRTT